MRYQGAFAAFFSTLLSCGGGSFTPCGGDLTGQWTLVTSATDQETAGACRIEAPASGFVVFNANGRYSLMAQLETWGPGCMTNVAFGGFYRVEGARLCLADAGQEGAAIGCDESVRPTSQHAVADFCVKGDRLELVSKTLLSPPGISHLIFTKTM